MAESVPSTISIDSDSTNLKSPSNMSSDSSVELIGVRLDASEDVYYTDSRYAATGSGQKSGPASSLKKRKSSNILDKSCSGPTSPASSVHDMENVSRVPRENFSLPYFKFPNPDLDEFLIETVKKLHVPEINTRYVYL